MVRNSQTPLDVRCPAAMSAAESAAPRISGCFSTCRNIAAPSNELIEQNRHQGREVLLAELVDFVGGATLPGGFVRFVAM